MQHSPDSYVIASYLFHLLIMRNCNFVQLEMEDGDEIDAMLHQTGGGHKFLQMYDDHLHQNA